MWCQRCCARGQETIACRANQQLPCVITGSGRHRHRQPCPPCWQCRSWHGGTRCAAACGGGGGSRAAAREAGAQWRAVGRRQCQRHCQSAAEPAAKLLALYRHTGCPAAAAAAATRPRVVTDSLSWKIYSTFSYQTTLNGLQHVGHTCMHLMRESLPNIIYSWLGIFIIAVKI